MLEQRLAEKRWIVRVNALLRRADMIRQLLAADLDPGREPYLEHKGIRVDIERHLVTLNNEPLDLSRTEFDLLHLLFRNPGRAFSRTYLLETIWGAAYVGGDRSVDNAILRLRKKLDELGDEIETVWGVGYRLRP